MDEKRRRKHHLTIFFYNFSIENEQFTNTPFFQRFLIVLSPFFDVEIIGQSRTAKIHRKVMSILNILSLLFYSENFCDRFPKAVEYITKLKTNYWLKYLHLGKPESCRRLLAICKKNDQS